MNFLGSLYFIHIKCKVYKPYVFHFNYLKSTKIGQQEYNWLSITHHKRVHRTARIVHPGLVYNTRAPRSRLCSYSNSRPWTGNRSCGGGGSESPISDRGYRSWCDSRYPCNPCRWACRHTLSQL